MTTSLPEGVYGHVMSFIPRNDTAQLIVNAASEDKLVLRYLRRYQVVNEDYKETLYRELAPSALGKSTYGDDDAPMTIIRTKISVGERLRLRTISEKKGCVWFHRSNM
jgi:hypothetical protein